MVWKLSFKLSVALCFLVIYFQGRKKKQQSGSRYERVGGPRSQEVPGQRRREGVFSGEGQVRAGTGGGSIQQRQMRRKAVSPERTGTAESWGDAEGGSPWGAHKEK